jgi:hypothetical protein
VLAAQGLGAVARAALADARDAFVAAGHRYEAARCARLEVRIAGTGVVADEVRALDALVVVDADA